MFSEERYVDVLGIKDRKTKGTYYTPREIVDYMCKVSLLNYLIKNTGYDYELINKFIHLGEINSKGYDLRLIDNCLAEIKVADISVGAGVFIISMLNEIIKARAVITEYLLNNVTEKQAEEILVRRSTKNLTIHALKNSIFASDIEHKAVEFTKERVCDILEEESLSIKLEELNIVHTDSLNNHFTNKYPFNQKFDIIVGNPPYVDSEEMTKNLENLRTNCLRKFKSARGNWDLFVVFVEQGFNILKENGIITYIVPNKLLSAKYTEQLRKIMLQHNIIELRDLSNLPVFKNANAYPIIFVANKTTKKEKVKVTVMETPLEIKSQTYIAPKMFYQDIHWSRYFSVNQNVIKIINFLTNLPKLKKHAYIYGSATVSEAYKVKKYLQEYTQKLTSYKKLINTGTLDPYQSWWGIKKTKYIKNIYQRPVITEENLKNISYKRYLQANSAKIIIGGMTKHLECYYDNGEYIAGKSTVIIFEKNVELKYVLAVLNSKLISFFYRNFFKSLSLANGYLRVGPPQIKEIPIVNPNNAIKNQIINLVDNILKITLATDYPINNFQQEEVEKYKKAIDDCIYKIYELKPKQIQLLENETL